MVKKSAESENHRFTVWKSKSLLTILTLFVKFHSKFAHLNKENTVISMQKPPSVSHQNVL